MCNRPDRLCTCNLYQNTYVATANNTSQTQQEIPMRSFTQRVLPFIAAAGISGLMFTAALI
jgi:hypothetical protein